MRSRLLVAVGVLYCMLCILPRVAFSLSWIPNSPFSCTAPVASVSTLLRLSSLNVKEGNITNTLDDAGPFPNFYSFRCLTSPGLALGGIWF
ncbi:hypothetical protein LY78DRAFT_661826 [Colletotrichum sublineola]|nr:hypothetical protein LY78DRAFT_661826 [Colletotrichum sublineola]